VGSNQHRTRWGPDLPAPDRALGAPPGAPERLRCGEVWGTRCRAWVDPPDFSHGEHPSPEGRAARAQDPACPPGLLQLLAGDSGWGVRKAARANPQCPPHWEALGQL